MTEHERNQIIANLMGIALTGDMDKYTFATSHVWLKQHVPEYRDQTDMNYFCAAPSLPKDEIRQVAQYRLERFLALTQGGNDDTAT